MVTNCSDSDNDTTQDFSKASNASFFDEEEIGKTLAGGNCQYTIDYWIILQHIAHHLSLQRSGIYNENIRVIILQPF